MTKEIEIFRNSEAFLKLWREIFPVFVSHVRRIFGVGLSGYVHQPVCVEIHCENPVS